MSHLAMTVRLKMYKFYNQVIPLLSACNQRELKHMHKGHHKRMLLAILWK